MTYILISFVCRSVGYLDNSVSQLVLLHVVSTRFLSHVCISKKQPTKNRATEELF